MGIHSFLSRGRGAADYVMKGGGKLKLYCQFTKPYIASKFYHTYEIFINK
jgi:hypothetical protein